MTKIYIVGHKSRVGQVLVRRLFSRLVLAASVFKGKFETNKIFTK